MVQHIIVFVIVAICAGVVIRVVLRVLAGKQSTCSLCQDCEVKHACTNEPCEVPPDDCPNRDQETGEVDCPR